MRMELLFTSVITRYSRSSVSAFQAGQSRANANAVLAAPYLALQDWLVCGSSAAGRPSYWAAMPFWTGEIDCRRAACRLRSLPGPVPALGCGA